MNNLVKKTVAGLTVGVVTLYTLPAYAFASTESVYSKLRANGECSQTIVTTKDDDGVNQEKCDKELPVETKVTYTLNGEEISSSDLAGKSGKVTVKIEYINKSAKNVYVNGSYQTMYTPFVMVVGTMIDSENNKNIEVKNSKVIENGGKAIVVGVVLPGLEESLNLSGNLAGINIPSSIEITMDSKNFEMKNIMSYGTPKLIDEDINWSKLDDLLNKVNVLQSSANQLEDGVNQLKNGISELKTGSQTLNEGAVKLSNGAESLDNGISSLKDGANKLNAGASSLSAGTSELSNGAVSVNNGAGALKAGLESLQSNAGALANGMNTISTSVSSLNDGMNTINTSVKGLQAGLGKYESQAENLQTLIDTNKAVMASTTDENVKALLQQNITALESEKQLLSMTSKVGELGAGIDTVSKGLNTLNEGTKNLPGQATALTTGVNQLVKGANELSQGTAKLSAGAVSVNNGAKQLAQGTGSVVDGANKLSEGSKALSEGAKQLSNGTTSLADGTVKLENGSIELADGMHRFNSEGINKIANFVNRDLDGLISRGKKLQELADEYVSYASDEKRESIKFISIIDSVKTSQKDEDKQEVSVEGKK